MENNSGFNFCLPNSKSGPTSAFPCTPSLRLTVLLGQHDPRSWTSRSLPSSDDNQNANLKVGVWSNLVCRSFFAAAQASHRFDPKGSVLGLVLTSLDRAHLHTCFSSVAVCPRSVLRAFKQDPAGSVRSSSPQIFSLCSCRFLTPDFTLLPHSLSFQLREQSRTQP